MMNNPLIITCAVVGSELSKKDSKEKRSTKLKKNLPVTENYLAISKEEVDLFICDKGNPRVVQIRDPEMIQIYFDNFKSLWKS